MKKLSKITESIWSDMQDRSSGETIRKEDKFNPDYVDFGDDTTVYWAIDNLEIDGEGKFYFDDIKDYNNNGWRLPTVDEVNQLKWNIWISWNKGCNHLKFDDGNEVETLTNPSSIASMNNIDNKAVVPMRYSAKNIVKKFFDVIFFIHLNLPFHRCFRWYLRQMCDY